MGKSSTGFICFSIAVGADAEFILTGLQGQIQWEYRDVSPQNFEKQFQKLQAGKSLEKGDKAIPISSPPHKKSWICLWRQTYCTFFLIDKPNYLVTN